MISEIRRTWERRIDGGTSNDDWRDACYDSVTMFTTPNATSKERSLCGLCNMDSNEYQVWMYPTLDIPQQGIIWVMENVSKIKSEYVDSHDHLNTI